MVESDTSSSSSSSSAAILLNLIAFFLTLLWGGRLSNSGFRVSLKEEGSGVKLPTLWLEETLYTPPVIPAITPFSVPGLKNGLYCVCEQGHWHSSAQQRCCRCVTLYGDDSILSPKRTWPRFSDGRLFVSFEQKSNLSKQLTASNPFS